MKDKGFVPKVMDPPILFGTISNAAILSMASALDLIATIPMIIDGVSLHLPTTSIMPPSCTLSSYVSLSSIVSSILDLGKDWNTTKHALPVYMLLKAIIIVCG